MRNALGYGFDYLGSLVYQTDALGTRLESAAFAGGRILRMEYASRLGPEIVYIPQYHLTDHLGSTRVVVNRDNVIQTRNDYYPFGGRWNGDGEAATNRWQFNGKESQQDFGVNLLDYGARMFAPRDGRWLTQDPLSEDYYSVSPYAFCVNNPMNYIDPNGMDVYFMTTLGSMVLALKNDEDYDRIYGLANRKIDFTSYIDMDKSFINNSRVSYVDVYERGEWSGLATVHSYFSYDGDALQDFFEFASKHSAVEWGFVKSKGLYDNLYTSHQKAHLEGGGSIQNDNSILYHVHNHRVGSSPSPSDFSSAEKRPTIRHLLYIDKIRDFKSNAAKYRSYPNPLLD